MKQPRIRTRERQWVRCAYVFVLLVILQVLPAFAGELRDDRGISVSWTAKPERIVALSPHLVEIAFAAGAGRQLAAGVRFSDYPEAAASLPQVGDASRIDLERVLAIGPDLILGWQSGNPAGDLQRLEQRGFRVFVTEPRRLTDIARLLRLVGVLAGTEAHAERAAAAFEARLEALRRRYGARTPVRVFYEIWHRPLLTVNGRHIISDLIELCGGSNVFADAPVLTPSVSLEAVLHARPQVILGGSSSMEPAAFASEWRHVRSAGLREVPVRHVPPDLVQRQTPRIAEGAGTVCEHIDAIRHAHR
ncbi:MAG: cobalamin-binding protein [Burkholderiales bacterium]